MSQLHFRRSLELEILRAGQFQGSYKNQNLSQAAASTLARADNPRSRVFWVKLRKEKQLYFRVNLIMYVFDGGRRLDLKGLYLDISKCSACRVPRGTNKPRGN